jgi:hypothetical protein
MASGFADMPMPTSFQYRRLAADVYADIFWLHIFGAIIAASRCRDRGCRPVLILRWLAQHAAAA